MTVDSESISILLADGKALFREALRTILECEGGFRVVAEVEDGASAIMEAERTRPVLALLDAGLRDCTTARATRAIRERVPDCRVVVLSDDENLQTLVETLDSGAIGFVPRTAAFVDLIDAVLCVARGEVVVPRTMLANLLEQLLSRKRLQSELVERISRLTIRQREVLRLLTQGADNDMIAARLVISPETARTHVQNLIRKLGVHSRLEAAAILTRTGLVDELTGADDTTTRAPVGAVG
jgi:DNA-binding NarL/FixJ family response regulator